MNTWYDRFPGPHGSLARRLRSEVNSEHYPALDELYIHHLLREQYDDVRYEEAPLGPDFRAYDDGRCVPGVEVLSLFERADWDSEELRHARLEEELVNRVRPTAGYFVGFEIDSYVRDPSPRRFAQWVRDQISALPPHDQLPLPSHPTDQDLPSAVYQDDNGTELRVRFLPIRPGAAAKNDPDARIVGMGPIIRRLRQQRRPPEGPC